MTFSNTPVSVILTGEEWFAICAKLANKGLSDKGKRLVYVAADKLGKQLVAAANRLNGKVVNDVIPGTGC
jgi:hypothetical protein